MKRVLQAPGPTKPNSTPWALSISPTSSDGSVLSLSHSQHPKGLWTHSLEHSPPSCLCFSTLMRHLSPEERPLSSPPPAPSPKVHNLLLQASLHHGYTATFLHMSCHLAAICPRELRPALTQVFPAQKQHLDEEEGLRSGLINGPEMKCHHCCLL